MFIIGIALLVLTLARELFMLFIDPPFKKHILMINRLLLYCGYFLTVRRCHYSDQKHANNEIMADFIKDFKYFKTEEAALQNGCSAAKWPADGGKELPEHLFNVQNTQEIIRL